MFNNGQKFILYLNTLVDTEKQKDIFIKVPVFMIRLENVSGMCVSVL